MNELLCITIPLSLSLSLSLSLQDISRILSTFSLEMLEELAKRSLVVHDQNLERFREEYFADVEKQGQQNQAENEREK